MGAEVVLIDSGEETAGAVAQALDAQSLSAPADAATHRFAVSDDEARFRQVGARFIGDRMGRATVVPLD
jgi:glutamate racemase